MRASQNPLHGRLEDSSAPSGRRRRRRSQVALNSGTTRADILTVRRDDEGFTLVELMVVVLIIAVLLAVAIPTFLGARERANDRAAQSNVRNAHVAELVYFAGPAQKFTADEPALRAIDASLAWTTNPGEMALSPRHIYVTVLDADSTVILGAKSGSGRCFWLRTMGYKHEPRFAENDCVATPPAAADFTDAW